MNPKLHFARAVLCALLLLAFSEGNMIGTAAPEWKNQDWINSKPLTVSELKGKVVLLRFFMESSCPYCRATSPYLNRFHESFNSEGLVVIGMYTPKPRPRQTSIETVRRYVQDYGFEFPVALDNDWDTLKSFWLSRVPNADYTSVSFLIDKRGIVRYVHPGGAYSEEDAAAIEKQIRQLLSE